MILTTISGNTRDVPSPAWKLECDVVAVGTGAAAMAAALGAHDGGAITVVLERRRKPGGTTQRSGGQYWIPGNSLMGASGFSDDPQEALQYMARLTFPALYRENSETLGIPPRDYALLRAYCEQAPRVIDRLASIGALRSEVSQLHPTFSEWTDRTQLDYHVDLQPVPRPGRHLNVAGGVGGEDLVRALVGAVEERGIDTLYEHRVTGLYQNDEGRVVGVSAETPDGEVAVGARCGVVFGSGGFAHNEDMVAEHLRVPVVGSCAIPSNTGDFQQLAVQLGAEIDNMGSAWWNQVVVEDALENPKSPAAVWLPYGDSMIIVNRFGRRVVNEKAIYNERSQVHQEWDPSAKDYSNRLLFMLFDHRVVSSEWSSEFRWPVPLPGERPSYVIRGDWWEELADRLATRLERVSDDVGPVSLVPDFLENLLETIEHYNAGATAGVDKEFRRDETPIMGWHGPPRPDNSGHPLMHPFPIDGPFYCVILGLGAIDTKGGPRIDEHGRVLRPSGESVQGLYGAGNCVSSPARDAYWSAGTTIGLALTFGFIAGAHASAMDPAEVDRAAIQN